MSIDENHGYATNKQLFRSRKAFGQRTVSVVLKNHRFARQLKPIVLGEILLAFVNVSSSLYICCLQ